MLHECPVCGEYSLRIWKEQHEYWGSICYETLEECLNPNCGEPVAEQEE